MSRVSYNHSFLLTLAFKTRTCVMALLVPALVKIQPQRDRKFNPNLTDIAVPYESMFNIEVFNTCQMPFGLSKKFVFWGQFTKMCSTKFPPIIVKASTKNAYHKIPCLQFANRNIARLQSWHSGIHFQILITPTISTLQLWLGIDCNFGLASTTKCECGFSKHNWVKNDHRS